MRAVVTVTGKDKKGIIAKVSAFLAEKGVNVEDISQTILQDYFAMIMLVDISDIKVELSELAKECEQMGSEIVNNWESGPASPRKENSRKPSSTE